jgi:hypothetical protein
MSVGRGDVIRTLLGALEESERLVAAAPESAWSKPAYEGWTAKQLLCHVASTSGVAGFVLAMARNRGMKAGASQPSRSGGGFDQDEWNSQQVAMREGRTREEVLDEVRANIRRDLQAVEAAPDELLAAHFRAPWEIEGMVAEVIAESVRGHLMMHLRDVAVAMA